MRKLVSQLLDLRMDQSATSLLLCWHSLGLVSSGGYIVDCPPHGNGLYQLLRSSPATPATVKNGMKGRISEREEKKRKEKKRGRVKCSVARST